jgi:UDP-3-O-[3-hydroxymyristoyl] glucosamine N-acyltransferase
VIAASGQFGDRTVIIARNPKLAFARAAAWVLAEENNETGIHPSAVVAPDAGIGKNVRIGALAVIDAAASIGDGTVIESGCYVGKRSRIRKSFCQSIQRRCAWFC